VGASLACEVDYGRRESITRSHTLTHVMNLALNRVLGEGVSQKGSLVDEHKARFDFSHGKAMTAAQLQQVEQIVQEQVAERLPVHTGLVPLEQAMAIDGMMAVFGERYPDPVRVVSIGPTIEELLAEPKRPEWAQYSIELCGGNHVPASSALQSFALVEETAVAKGVRRVVGLTGGLAAAAIGTGDDLRGRFAGISATVPDNAAAIASAREAVTALKQAVDGATISAHVKAELREKEAAYSKKLQQAAKKLQQAATDNAANDAITVAAAAAAAGQKYAVLELPGGIDGKALQPLVQRVIKETGVAVLALSVDADSAKVACYAAVPDDAVGTLPANTWLQSALKEVGGRGGGKPGAAQGSGSELDGVPKAIEAAKSVADEAYA